MYQTRNRFCLFQQLTFKNSHREILNYEFIHRIFSGMTRSFHRLIFPISVFKRFVFLALLIFISSCTARRNVSEHTTAKKEDHFIKEYSARLGIPLDNKTNKELIIAVSEWLGVPYKYGGDSKSGTDCSGFIGQVYKKVYNKSISRSANGLYEEAKKINKNQLKDGDLVFFKINTTKVGHVGIYLKDGYFIHATTKRGVMVNNLNEDYYSKYYFASGRIID